MPQVSVVDPVAPEADDEVVIFGPATELMLLGVEVARLVAG